MTFMPDKLKKKIVTSMSTIQADLKNNLLTLQVQISGDGHLDTIFAEFILALTNGTIPLDELREKLQKMTELLDKIGNTIERSKIDDAMKEVTTPVKRMLSPPAMVLMVQTIDNSMPKFFQQLQLCVSFAMSPKEVGEIYTGLIYQEEDRGQIQNLLGDVKLYQSAFKTVANKLEEIKDNPDDIAELKTEFKKNYEQTALYAILAKLETLKRVGDDNETLPNEDGTCGRELRKTFTGNKCLGGGGKIETKILNKHIKDLRNMVNWFKGLLNRRPPTRVKRSVKRSKNQRKSKKNVNSRKKRLPKRRLKTKRKVRKIRK